ncbi:hypothetical protein EVAR_48221_1 [Eumeta japonica]|uniref:Uncharacterized protein n=1 Tax=Eumeta variegata TaxID=151549 RepID=A0A4C1YH85_EUMVA|nr:hypothetical protein EVAR_48221_1 [Eumeta japonica]
MAVTRQSSNLRSTKMSIQRDDTVREINYSVNWPWSNSPMYFSPGASLACLPALRCRRNAHKVAGGGARLGPGGGEKIIVEALDPK